MKHTTTIIPPDAERFAFEGLEVRVSSRDGEPWFVLADVCAVLDISKHRDAAARLDPNERGSVVVDTLGGPQDTVAVNESGLYSLILTSRKPEAKRFKKWVTAEVLPTIRKTGRYGVAAPDLYDPDVLRDLLLNYSQKELTLQNKIAEDAPKVAAADHLGKKHTTTIIHDEDDLMNRALKAYWRSGGIMQPNAADSRVHAHRGETVVVLRTGSDILRVYRVRVSGELRRIENFAETRYRWCL